MSRRIMFTLAASVAVIALLAVAGRECFDGRCNLPGLAEQPAPTSVATSSTSPSPLPAPVQAPSVQAPSPTAEQHAAAEAAREPVSPIASAIAPSVAVAQENKPVLAEVKPQEQPAARGARVLHATLTPPAEAAESKPSRIVRVASTSNARIVHVASLDPAALANDRSGPGMEIAPVAAASIYGGPAIVVAGVGLDPAWRRCQVGQRGYEYDNALCGPYSYHPYGIYGYRPYGTYAEYRRPQVFMIAPDAKIIQIRARD